MVREGEYGAVSFLSKIDDWFEECGHAKRAKNESSGTDRRTVLKGLGLAGGAVAASSLVTPEADVFFEGEEPDELPKEMKIVKGSAPGGTVASFVETRRPSKSTFFDVGPRKVWDRQRKMYI